MQEKQCKSDFLSFHKEGIPMRPIVPFIDSPLYN